MRVFALIVTTLCLAAVAQGFIDYQLECTRDEIGIRWPSYYSNSDYYVCSRVGGKQVKLSCNPGELFTFVLQACTKPGRFIPAPPVDLLPISSSKNDKFLNQPTNGESGSSEVALPKPLYPSHGLPTADLVLPGLPKEDKLVDGPPTPPTIELTTSDISSSPSSESSKPPTPPLPPTPEPTPPVVKKPVKLQPQAPGKKQPTAPNKKQPTKPEKKPPTPAKSAAKMPKKPAPQAKKPAPSKE
ncbi:extensin [Ceratitis capitata]|uniref:extensin n=1 Tax=Ceratitis capitata TaxID=7213 RepID=UPI0003298FCF|nr:extensin [Ceratitis capitata]